MGAQPAALRWLASRIRAFARLGAAAVSRHRERICHARTLEALNDRGLRDIGLFRVGEKIRAERSADCCHHLRSPQAEEDPFGAWQSTHNAACDRAPMDPGGNSNAIEAAD